MRHGVIFQPLRVGVGLPAIAAGVWLISCVAQLVSFHDGLWVGRYGHYQNGAIETSKGSSTVLFAISDQSTCLWALLVATIMGVSKISNNTVLRKYIGLQHIQRSGL